MSQGDGMIATVKGFISADKLGYCQCHEHIFIAKGKSYEVNPALFMDNKQKSLAELKMYISAGGQSMVDAQPVGCGRIADWLFEVSNESGVNIVASTGFHKLYFYNEDHWIFNKDEDYMTEIFIKEIKEGMYIDGDNHLPTKQIGAKAGIIKVAIDSFGIKEGYIKLFNAATNAAIETGVPVMCHMEKGSDAFEIINFFSKKGLNTDHLIICHLDRAKYDFSYHRDALESGVYMEYDTIGRPKYHSDEDELRLISKMVEEGYGNKILLGLDTTNQRLKSYGGFIGLDYILKEFIEKAKAYGLSKETFEKFTVVNPAKALSIKGVQANVLH